MRPWAVWAVSDMDVGGDGGGWSFTLLGVPSNPTHPVIPRRGLSTARHTSVCASTAKARTPSVPAQSHANIAARRSGTAGIPLRNALPVPRCRRGLQHKHSNPSPPRAELSCAPQPQPLRSAKQNTAPAARRAAIQTAAAPTSQPGTARLRAMGHCGAAGGMGGWGSEGERGWRRGKGGVRGKRGKWGRGDGKGEGQEGGREESKAEDAI